MQARYQAAPTALQERDATIVRPPSGVAVAGVRPLGRRSGLDFRRAGHRRDGAPDTRRGNHEGPRVRRSSRSDDLRHLAATTRPYLRPEHGRGRRQRRSHRDAVLPDPRPASPGPHHRVGPTVVRRLPALRLLLPSSRVVCCRVLGGVPLRCCLQARHDPRAGDAAGIRVGIRIAGRVQETNPSADGHGGRAVPVQHFVHDRGRKRDLDSRR